MSGFDLSCLDEQSALIALQVQMDDLDDLDTSKTHNTQPDQTSDAETSLHLYARELKRLKSTIGDKILAQSMANHALLENADGEAEINSTCCGRKRPRPFALQCEVCSEEKESTEVFRLNCDHLYCNECLQKLFEGLMTDESLFPPRCCRKTIDIENAGTFLTPDIIKRFNNRKIEIETPNRIYCSSNLCSSFIHPDNITADVATCQKCGIVTCAICKTESHAGDCPNDPAIQSLRHLSSEKGWQSCYNCNRIIELTTGCNHITCYCRAEFCYQCGHQWQTCSCPLWEEENLLLRAAEVVDQNDGGNIDPQERVQRILAAIGVLRQNPHCEHEAWDQINGPQKCDECSYRMPKFTFQCRECGIQFCQRCRRNRL